MKTSQNQTTEFPVSKIEQIIGYTFKDKSLLTTAFVHSSYAKKQNISDNERFEFFGDALLETISTEYLFKHYPKKDVGELSKARAAIVSAQGLKSVIDKMNILQFLQISGNAKSIKSMSHKIEANLFEALLCAVYLDSGMEKAKKFALRWLKPYLDHVDENISLDYKTLLQEYCQAAKVAIHYFEISKTGPDNNPVYQYGLELDGQLVSKGKGSSIKLAQTAAAKVAYLKHIKGKQ